MRKTVFSTFYCTQCGKENAFPIPRQVGRNREKGHLKAIWCINCGKECNMVEIKEFATSYKKEDFLLEFEHGNFDENGQRILPYGLFRAKMNEQGVDLP